MHLLFFNPQGNFDDADSYLAQHPDFGGQLVYVKEVAWAMAEAGCRVDIVTRLIDDPEWPEFSEPISRYSNAPAGLRIVRIPCGGRAFLPKEQLWDHLQEFVQATIGFYAGDLPDFATSHYADGGYCAAIMQVRTGLPFTFTGHSLGAQKMDKLGVNRGNSFEMEARFRFSRRIAAERLAMERAFRIITSTRQERMEQYAHALYSGAIDVNDDARFSVVPPGVNTRMFNSEGSDIDQAVAARLDGQLRHPSLQHLLVSSRIDEKKNILGAVAAYATSRELRSVADLVICARGVSDPFEQVRRMPDQDRAVLEPVLDLIRDAGLHDKVVFLDIGSQAELAATYRYFARLRSAFVLTAFYEPFGLAPIEAAACGLACVATRNGGPTEIFADGSGVLVDPFDNEDIAAGMLTALRNYDELSARASRRVREKYTWTQTAEGYSSVIRQGLSGGPADRPPPLPTLDSGARIAEYLS